MYKNMIDQYDALREAMEDMYAHAQERYERATDDVSSAKLLQIMEDINAFEKRVADWSTEVMA